MFIKQIDVNEALRLFAAGQKVLVMAPTVPEPQKWTDYTPDILQDMLSDCLFFRKEPAIVNQDFEDAFPGPNTEGVDSEPSGGAAEPASGPVGAGGKRKKVDRGKVMALHRAGWTNRKIADEMQIHEATVCRVIRDEIEKETIARIAGE